jgi:uracil-DNA glycosylase family 4
MAILERCDFADKETLFNSLVHSVTYCDLCARMCGRKKVLSTLNGNLHSKVLFIAEAPGRLGAECTGIPLLGDRTGDNFESLLSNIGWSRNDIFITNSVLCNPQDENGNNSTPNFDEIKKCSYYLSMTISIINPDVIVTLGVKALEAIKYISDHGFTLNRDVGTLLKWNGICLFPLYHTGPRALVHRDIVKQRADFITLSHYVDPIRGLKKNRNISIAAASEIKEKNSVLSCLLDYIIHKSKTVSMFKATKLLYMIDLSFLEKYGQTVTGSTYLRMQDGPWIPELKDIAVILENQKRIQINFVKRKAYYCALGNPQMTAVLSDKIEQIDQILLKYSESSDEQIKSAAYLSAPMRYILKEEKNNRSMLKIPVIYLNKTVAEIDNDQRTRSPV